MIEEVRIFGVYFPAPLAWAVLAFILAIPLRALAQRLPLYRLLWHPALVDLALFSAVWWGLSVLADHLPTHLLAW
jgi:hypothetical protein